MPPLLSNLKTLLGYVIAWSVIGFAAAQILENAGYATQSGALFFALPTFQMLGFILTSAYYVCRSLPITRRKAYQILPIYLSAPLVSAFAWLMLCLLWNNFTKNLGFDWAGISTPQQLIIGLFSLAALLYFISLLAHDIVLAFANLRDAERRQAAAQMLAREAELQLLRSQINPHFLFNSLNSISALTTIDPVAARNMTIELGDFFRKTLTLSDQTKITLAAELQLCEHYLAIEKIRFGQKLEIVIDRDAQCSTAKVLPMLLQPLIENAIKHGINHITENGVITITCFVRAPWLHLTVTNPKDASCVKNFQAENATQKKSYGTGTGLKNLQARLHNVYGDQARVAWQANNNAFVVDLVIPLEYA